MRFALPPGRSAESLAALRSLPGVTDVARHGDQVTVHGERSVIAHAGAWLVARGRIPDDLRVEVPDLETALLALLDAPADHETGAA